MKHLDGQFMSFGTHTTNSIISHVYIFTCLASNNKIDDIIAYIYVLFHFHTYIFIIYDIIVFTYVSFSHLAEAFSSALLIRARFVCVCCSRV